MTTTTVRERPILFRDAMVRAILEGRKTQTRRIVKPQPWYGSRVPDGPHYIWPPGSGNRYEADEIASKLPARCPYGQPGDRLWVREAWHHEDGSCYDKKCGQPTHIFYRATEVAPETIRWEPSIFMPRWASRLTLEVKRVRVERLSAITPADALAEGIEKGTAYETTPQKFIRAFRAMHKLADDADPWLWVIDFARVEAP